MATAADTTTSAAAAAAAETTAAAAAGAPAAELLDAILAVAVSAARGAGALMREHAGRTAVDKAKATSQDLVTAVDTACQELITAAVAGAFPEHAFLGEESVPPGAEASAAAIRALVAREWLWVVDPIDGTTNFIQGLPASVVSIAVAHRGTVMVGVIYEPYRDDLFTAVRGRGARRNGEPIAVSPDAAMRNAVFGFGTHHTPHVCSAMLRGVGAVAPRCRGVRSFGSAALHLAYTACGRLTGFWELDLSSWDIAAGSLLVTEAGGRVTDTRGEAYTLTTRDVFASNGADDVHGALLATLAAAGAVRPDPRA